jgi:hypothetical protein
MPHALKAPLHLIFEGFPFQTSTTASKQGTVALPEHNASYIFHQASKKITVNIQKEART